MIVIDTSAQNIHYLTASTVKELHTFAKIIGLGIKNFKDVKGHPHYELKVDSSPYQEAKSSGLVKMLTKVDYVRFVLENHRTGKLPDVCNVLPLGDIKPCLTVVKGGKQ